jgi:nucleotide-binding universal stress UspA family protein
MIALKNVLVATDFGVASETALAYGRDLARMFNATLHVFHAVDDLLSRAISVEGYATDVSGIQGAIEKSARERLEAIVADDDRRELRAKTVLWRASQPAAAIVAYAKEAGIDLIVMGTHGRGAMAHLLMGNVAERVVRTAGCPVLTVRHPEHEFIRPDALQAVTQA